MTVFRAPCPSPSAGGLAPEAAPLGTPPDPCEPRKAHFDAGGRSGSSDFDGGSSDDWPACPVSSSNGMWPLPTPERRNWRLRTGRELFKERRCGEGEHTSPPLSPWRIVKPVTKKLGRAQLPQEPAGSSAALRDGKSLQPRDERGADAHRGDRSRRAYLPHHPARELGIARVIGPPKDTCLQCISKRPLQCLTGNCMLWTRLTLGPRRPR
jgi:hypothetical protein